MRPNTYPILVPYISMMMVCSLLVGGELPSHLLEPEQHLLKLQLDCLALTPQLLLLRLLSFDFSQERVVYFFSLNTFFQHFLEGR